MGIDQESKSIDDDIPDILPTSSSMLDKNLLDLYTNAIKNSKQSIQVRLQTRPISSKIISTSMMIYSRNMVQKNPELKGLWKKSTNEIYSYIYDNILLFSTKGGEFTVICQVLIQCKEIFWVKDIKSGTIIQGSEDGDDCEKDVVHLVRFEIPCRYSASRGLVFEPESWIISDWDDLLKGNLFF